MKIVILSLLAVVLLHAQDKAVIGPCATGTVIRVVHNGDNTVIVDCQKESDGPTQAQIDKYAGFGVTYPVGQSKWRKTIEEEKSTNSNSSKKEVEPCGRMHTAQPFTEDEFEKWGYKGVKACFIHDGYYFKPTPCIDGPTDKSRLDALLTRLKELNAIMLRFDAEMNTLRSDINKAKAGQK
jgi:hypothetical protein